MKITGKELFELARRAGLLSGAYSGLSYDDVREFTTNDDSGRGVMQACEEVAAAVTAEHDNGEFERDARIEKLDPIFQVEGRHAGRVMLVIDFRGDDYAAIRAAQDRILQVL